MLFLLLLLATFLEAYRQVRFLDFLLTVFLRITFLICWLAFSQSSPPHCRLQFCFVDFVFFLTAVLYLHLLISASPLIVQCACSLTFRWGFDGRRPVTRPICQGWIKISSNNELSPVLIRLLPQILVSGNWRRMLVSCCTGKGLGMRFNWDNYEHDRVATFIILCLRSQTFYSWLQFTLYTATSTAAFAEP